MRTHQSSLSSSSSSSPSRPSSTSASSFTIVALHVAHVVLHTTGTAAAAAAVLATTGRTTHAHTSLTHHSASCVRITFFCVVRHVVHNRNSSQYSHSIHPELLLRHEAPQPPAQINNSRTQPVRRQCAAHRRSMKCANNHHTQACTRTYAHVRCSAARPRRRSAVGWLTTRWRSMSPSRQAATRIGSACSAGDSGSPRRPRARAASHCSA